MECFPFTNSCFQMGVTVMGFAEDFGLCILADQGATELKEVKVGNLKKNLTQQSTISTYNHFF